MKYRIVERKYDNGKSYYIIQYRRFWIWWNYSIDEVWDNSRDCREIFHYAFQFDSEGRAKSALERTQMQHTHKGVAIYPTIDKDVFYSLLGAKRHEKGDWFVNLICGSYDSCCKQIDEYLEAKKNRKYKKIINL